MTTVTPDGWWAGQKQDITITGTDFLRDTDPGGPSQVTVTDGAGAVKLSNVRVISSTEIKATVDVSKDAPNSPAETATLTVTNPPANGTPQTATANPAPVVLPIPEIDWLGRRITGDHPQIRHPNVKVGQPVELTTKPATLPGGATIISSTWVVPGTSIKQFHEDDEDGISVDETDLDTPNTTFYWLYPDTGLNVTYNYCAMDPYGNPICTSPQAKATFKAAGPTASLSTWDSKEAKIEPLSLCDTAGRPFKPNQTAPYLGYGDLRGPTPECPGKQDGTVGIRLPASGASGGKYAFAQIVNADFNVYAYPAPAGGGPAPPPTTCGPHAGLDKQYPFPGVNNPASPTFAYDGPEMPLPPIYATGTRNFYATMYLLWQPDQLSGTATGSIPVPMGYQDWDFVATAFQDLPIGNGKWGKNPTLTASGDEGGGFEPATPYDNAIYGYPQWSAIVSNDCGVSQAINSNAVHARPLWNYTPSTNYGFSKGEK